MAEVFVRYLGKHVKAFGVGPSTGKYELTYLLIGLLHNRFYASC